MDGNSTFNYTYSAHQNQEVQAIRQKYMPREETRLEELKRLDHQVQTSGTPESLCVGIGSCLVFSLGLCLAMEVIGNAMWLGIVLGLLGTAGMLFAYPVYRKRFAQAKDRCTPRILQLVDELTGENS